MKEFDVIIIGAGGAGMMCAIQSGKRGRKVALLDHASKIGAKILISGGGRCNFTNIGATAGNYVSQNPHFCRSALSRFTPGDFIQMVKDYRIPYHEKKLGQLFCDRSAKDIVDMLVSECGKAGVEFVMDCKVEKISQIPLTLPISHTALTGKAPCVPAKPKTGGEGFKIKTDKGDFSCRSLVIATGGLSIPKVGATDLGYRLAQQFGLKTVKMSPALDGFRFSPSDLKRFGDLTGVSADVIVTCNGVPFRENILFTHAGLSGPAALQASLYWNEGDPVQIDFFPELGSAGLRDWLLSHKKKGTRSEIKTLLAEHLSKRLADRLCELELPAHATLSQLLDQAIRNLAGSFTRFTFTPYSTIGYNKAEVTRGGVDTAELSSKTMECKKIPGLYFIGEVVDVTGQLGGYNFQWAWSSGWAAGQAV